MIDQEPPRTARTRRPLNLPAVDTLPNWNSTSHAGMGSLAKVVDDQ